MLQMENMSAREQILVVDDEPMICKSCKEILEDEGFFVDMAYSGEEGLKKGLEKKFDLVILAGSILQYQLSLPTPSFV